MHKLSKSVDIFVAQNFIFYYHYLGAKTGENFILIYVVTVKHHGASTNQAWLTKQTKAARSG